MDPETIKRVSLTALAIGIVLAGVQIGMSVIANYRLENSYTQLWRLADKSSTIPAKQQYIAQFVAALESGFKKGDFSEYAAIWLKTPNNSFKANLDALKSLSGRLDEIQKMNAASFEYNTAIQQITAQEQGEANEMLGVFEGCYNLASFPMVWNWIGGILVGVEMLLIFGGGMVWFWVKMEE